ncbi:MAG: hypothetical protein VKI83_05860 [Synechococcaceae cyanobacterium]|nr:hypothetical protein [Synechococcaceae cyanobacterium]
MRTPQALPSRFGGRRPQALVGLLVAAAGSLPARASSPQAWAEYERQMLKACTAASGLRQPRPAGDRLDFSQSDGSRTSVLLLQGRYPQAHMAARRGLELCLYDPRSRRARVVDADRLNTSRQP